MKVLVLILSLMTAACAPGSGSGEGSASEFTVLDDYGYSYDLPLNFTEFNLNEPKDIQFPIVINGAVFATCGLTITLDGTETEGFIRGTNARIVSGPSSGGTTRCENYNGLNAQYVITDEGLVMNDGFLFFRR